MKQEKAHGDYFYFPPDENSPSDQTQVEQKDSTFVQGRRGVVDYPYDAAENYARQNYDFLDERRDTAPASGVNVVIDFGRVIKKLWVTCPTGSASSLFFNLDGAAANANGSLQVVASETREFTVGARKINLSSDGVGIAGFRVTWGY